MSGKRTPSQRPPIRAPVVHVAGVRVSGAWHRADSNYFFSLNLSSYLQLSETKARHLVIFPQDSGTPFPSCPMRPLIECTERPPCSRRCSLHCQIEVTPSPVTRASPRPWSCQARAAAHDPTLLSTRTCHRHHCQVTRCPLPCP